MTKRVCIVNAHWSNRGDEAALRPIIDSICQKRLGVELTVIFKDRKPVQQFPYQDVKHISAQFLPQKIYDVYECIDNVGDSNVELKKVVDILRETDLIIYSPGGAVISDKFWWMKQVEYLVPFICAEKFEIPIIVAAPSMGPFDDNIEKNKYRYRWLSTAKKICVREPISKKYLETLGLKNVEETIDTAFLDNPDIETNEQYLKNNPELVNFFHRYNKVVSVTLSDFSWNVEHGNKKELGCKIETDIKKFIDHLKNQGIGVLLIPQLFGNQNDYEYLKLFYDENTYILSDTYDTYFQQYIVSKCYANIGMRYHSNIFAAKMGIPFIAIGYEEKMYGFMDRWTLKQYLIKIDDFAYDKLEEKWICLNATYKKYKKCLEELRDEWRRRAQRTISIVMNSIESIDEDKHGATNI